MDKTGAECFVYAKACGLLAKSFTGSRAAALFDARSLSELWTLLFRTQAPELVHLPDATFEWYAQNYLDRYYPVRFILKMNGVKFPDLAQKED